MGDKQLTAYLGQDVVLEVPVQHVYQLRQFDIKGDITFITKEQKETVKDPCQLVDLLALSPTILEKDDLQAFKLEVENSVYNYALGLTSVPIRFASLPKENSVWEYVTNQSTNFSPLTFFEQLVIQGHTIHPCSRTRLGMAAEAVTTYAPEWGSDFEVPVVAVHQRHVHVTNKEGEGITELLLKDYPSFQAQLKKQLGEEWKQYELIPVHPWQLENTIIPRYQKEITEKVVVPLEKISIPMSALVSFRSLSPTGSKRLHHIKTAINVQMTSAVRTVSAASTINGPKLSVILEQLEREANVQFLQEKSGIHFIPSEHLSDTDKNFYEKNLASIIRENPEAKLHTGEVAMPGVSLLAPSPFTNKMVIEELIQSLAEKENLSQEAATKAFLQKYVDVVLPGVLTLMTKFGISLEVHLQNAVIVFQDKLPKRLLIRDNGGVRIMPSRLGQEVDIDNRTNLLTDEAKDLHAIFSHAVIHNHLGEIIVALTRKGLSKEETLWNIVRTKIEEVFSRLPHAEMDREAILAPTTTMKALVKMRLSDAFMDNLYVTLPNPLHLKEVKQP
ncbi:IucA/IucC family protein [Mangrovibacillus cuniculi]|uniref:Siderophore synthetase component n=1 Tax=Mangrovibacillus cuniculi TaxID=2593652 RepID=A0A7S8HEQ4_9BACI|nr:IucA/IucC family protein [Mangrovibacillus cuniculi]QPC45635.1 hypothetical protein G8O30_00930 [Mangrovibacillus cuniculi]